MKLAQKKQENIASRLAFDTNGVDWPSMANPTGSEHKYKWFCLECDKDLNDFCQAYKTYNRDLNDPELVKQALNGYPDYICLVDYPRGPEEPDWFTLSALLRQMNAFLTNIPEDDLYFMQIPKDAVFTKVIKLSKTELDAMNKVLTMTGKELYDKYGYKRDETITWTADFGGGIEADIKSVICGEDEKPYCEGVLFHDGSEVCCTDGIASELDGKWEFEYYGRTFLVEVKVFETSEYPQFIKVVFYETWDSKEPYWVGNRALISGNSMYGKILLLENLTKDPKNRDLHKVGEVVEGFKWEWNGGVPLEGEDLERVKKLYGTIYRNEIVLTEFDRFEDVRDISKTDFCKMHGCEPDHFSDVLNKVQWTCEFADGMRAVIRMVLDEEGRVCLVGSLVETSPNGDYIIDCDVNAPEKGTGEWIFGYSGKRYIVDVKQEDDNAE